MKHLINIYYLVAIGLGIVHVANSNAVSQHHAALAEYRSPSAVVDRTIDDTLQLLTFGLYKPPERGVDVEAVLNAAAEAANIAWNAGLAFALITVAFIAFHIVFERRANTPTLAFPLHLLGVALLCLAIGITAPLLTISATQALPVVGEVVLSHESKSILSLIESLWHRGDWLIGGLILLFSLIVPIAKLALAMIALLRDTPFTRRARALAHHLGRWSMADVFVVAVLIAFLTTGKAPHTEGAIGTGLYFFAAHTLLAVLASQLMQRHETQRGLQLA